MFETSQKCCIAPQLAPTGAASYKWGTSDPYCWFNVPPRTLSAAMNRWEIEAAVRVAAATFKTLSKPIFNELL
jgi:hypothetical protein